MLLLANNDAFHNNLCRSMKCQKICVRWQSDIKISLRVFLCASFHAHLFCSFLLDSCVNHLIPSTDGRQACNHVTRLQKRRSHFKLSFLGTPFNCSGFSPGAGGVVFWRINRVSPKAPFKKKEFLVLVPTYKSRTGGHENSVDLRRQTRNILRI